MTTQVVVPTLGESVLEATVSQWLKGEGDAVQAGDVLVELETDKVNVEVGAERAGVLSRIEKQEGEDVKVGEVLAVIEEEAAGATPPPETTALQGAAGSASAPLEAPLEGQNGAERAGQPQAERAGELAEERAATPVARRMAEEMGLDLAKIPTEPGGRVTKEAVESYLRQQEVSAPAQTPSRSTYSQAQGGSGQRDAAAEPGDTPKPGTGAGPGAPAQPGVPAQQQTGEGSRAETAPNSAPTGPSIGAPSVIPIGGQKQDGRREERLRMSRRRRTIAQRLVEAQRTAAMLTTFNEIDMSAVMDLRKRRNEDFQERYGVKLGFTSFFVKASIGALKAFPRINAELQGDEMVLKGYYDIGIAVGAEDGLVVPVVREADRLSFAEIEKRVAEFAEKAKSGTLSIEDLRGGTFTITNGGVFGSLMSTPILNPPQVGILGLHKIEPRPVAIEDEVVIRPMMYVALSYDHRIVDGREAVQFLVRVKNLIEDPETLLLEG
jgi:2-oxoglutarate dehydrogenase E2 component (dihydrolipoamide succinyltransferase)